MTRTWLFAAAGFMLAACATTTPPNSANADPHDCKAMMEKMHKDAGQMPPMSPGKMKMCPAMGAQTAPPNGDHAEHH